MTINNLKLVKNNYKTDNDLIVAFRKCDKIKKFKLKLIIIKK